MDPQKILTLRIGSWTPAARAALLAAARHDTSGGLQSIEEICNGGTLFELADDDSGAVVLTYVLKINARSHGKEGAIVAAAGGLPGVDLTRKWIPVIEQQFSQEGCSAVTVHTRRPAMRAKLESLGYRCDAWVMRKTLETMQ